MKTLQFLVGSVLIFTIPHLSGCLPVPDEDSILPDVDPSSLDLPTPDNTAYKDKKETKYQPPLSQVEEPFSNQDSGLNLEPQDNFDIGNEDVDSAGDDGSLSPGGSPGELESSDNTAKSDKEESKYKQHPGGDNNIPDSKFDPDTGKLDIAGSELNQKQDPDVLAQEKASNWQGSHSDDLKWANNPEVGILGREKDPSKIEQDDSFFDDERQNDLAEDPGSVESGLISPTEKNEKEFGDQPEAKIDNLKNGLADDTDPAGPGLISPTKKNEKKDDEIQFGDQPEVKIDNLKNGLADDTDPSGPGLISPTGKNEKKDDEIQFGDQPKTKEDKSDLNVDHTQEPNETILNEKSGPKVGSIEENPGSKENIEKTEEDHSYQPEQVQSETNTAGHDGDLTEHSLGGDPDNKLEDKEEGIPSNLDIQTNQLNSDATENSTTEPEQVEQTDDEAAEGGTSQDENKKPSENLDDLPENTLKIAPTEQTSAETAEPVKNILEKSTLVESAMPQSTGASIVEKPDSTQQLVASLPTVVATGKEDLITEATESAIAETDAVRSTAGPSEQTSHKIESDIGITTPRQSKHRLTTRSNSQKVTMQNVINMNTNDTVVMPKNSTSPSGSVKSTAAVVVNIETTTQPATIVSTTAAEEAMTTKSETSKPSMEESTTKPSSTSSQEETTTAGKELTSTQAQAEHVVPVVVTEENEIKQITKGKENETEIGHIRKRPHVDAGREGGGEYHKDTDKNTEEVHPPVHDVSSKSTAKPDTTHPSQVNGSVNMGDAVSKVKTYVQNIVREYGPLKVSLALLTVLLVSLISILCCCKFCRRKGSMMRQRRLKEFGQEKEFLLSDRNSKSQYSNDRVTLLDGSSEDEF